MPTPAQAGDFAFSIGRDLGVVDFTGARSITNVGTRLGYRHDKIQVFGTGDFARYRLNTDYASPDFTDSSQSGGIYTVGVGAKYFFTKPEASQAVAYSTATAFTLIPYANQSRQNATDTDAFAGGVMAGFGAEYFFDESFSVGGELGAGGVFGYLQQETTTWEGNILQLYSGVQLNFYL
jgi:hypothetical protein